MTKQEAIALVRTQYLRGEIETVNVYYRLERWLSAAEITATIREWQESE